MKGYVCVAEELNRGTWLAVLGCGSQDSYTPVLHQQQGILYVRKACVCVILITGLLW